MFRTFAVIAFFAARMIVAVFDLGIPEPPSAGLPANNPVVDGAAPGPAPTIISGLPEDAGTLRR
jgi:hypothetical protein